MVDEVSSQSVIDKHNGKMIVDFTATWCGPCKQIAPTFEALSKEYSSLKFIKVDVDKSPEIASKYGVTAMPTFKIIENGVAIDELKGASPAALRNLCDQHKGASTFKGTGHRLGGSGPSTVKQGVSYEPPKFIKTTVVFILPFLVFVVVKAILGVLYKK